MAGHERPREHTHDRPCHQISDRRVGADGVIECPPRPGGVISPKSPLAWPLLALPADSATEVHHACSSLAHLAAPEQRRYIKQQGLERAIVVPPVPSGLS